MKLKLFYCFLSIFLSSLKKCETKESILILNIPGEDWRIDHGHHILRDRYADACIKVAIRKCFKALMQVLKKVCSSYYKCNSILKSDFKNQAKTKCLREFDYSKTRNTENNKVSTELDDYRFANAARENFLDACIPHVVPQNTKKSIRVLRTDILETLVVQILRSRAERECEKLSRAKCIKACVDASSVVCSVHNCSRRRRSKFKKTCRYECKSAYQVHSISKNSDSENSS